jgi:voltage-gated potassium channel
MAEPVREDLRLRARLRALYHGASPAAVRFRYAIILIDLAIIAFFIAAPLMQRHGLTFYLIDYGVAAFLGLDLAARAVAHGDIKSWLKKPIVWLDLFVLATLLFPAWLFNFGFLRVVRLWTVIHSEFFWRTIGRRYDDTRVEEITRAGASLLTFIFVVTGFVYTSFVGRHDGVTGYVDALYFTVTSLTTTGYGDVTLPGVWGKLLSMAVMLGGVSLFIGLIQSILRPHKVIYQCHDCGLRRHDPDAVHCKACGKLLNIPDDGV